MEGLTNDIRNNVTDDNNYRRHNPYLLAAYAALPSKLMRVALVLFQRLTANLMVGFKGAQKNIYENRRIYIDVHLTIDDILRACNVGKYADGGLHKKGKDIETDRKNMRDTLRKLFNYNIFYIWKYKSSYLFIFERDIGCWKFFNSKGCVTPKTLKKILVLAVGIMDRMGYFEGKVGRTIDRKHLEQSFACFLEIMISKMNPLVSASLPSFLSCDNLYDYINLLEKSLEGVDDFEGLVHADNYTLMLPPFITEKYEKDIQEGRKTMNNRKTDMEKELTADANNICTNKGMKPPKKKKTKDVKPVGEKGEVDIFSYKEEYDVDPFKDAKAFTEYYRHFIALHSKKQPRFEKISMGFEYAGHILDDLRELNKKGDKVFLNAWLENYLANKLKGNKIRNIEHTSLCSFRKTLVKFNNIFFVP